MRVLSLFSGGGLGDYGLELAGMEIVGQVEIEDYCQKIIKLRWPDVPKWGDIKNVKGSEIQRIAGAIDIISGGFPCQPFSVAGKKRGKDDERNMWPEMYRLICEIKPAWVFAENVRGIVKPYLDTVLADLERIGYTCLPLLIPACAIGAPHRRERLWIIANATGERCNNGRDNRKGRQVLRNENGDAEKNKSERNRRKRRIGSIGSDVANAESVGWDERPNIGRKKRKEIGRNITCECGETFTFNEKQNRWVEPAICRMVNGSANRVDRLKLLGNGQVVQVVEWIGKQIMEFNKELLTS